MGVGKPSPGAKAPPSPASGEGLEVKAVRETNALIYPHISVEEDLVSSRGDEAKLVSGNPGRHKTGPYTMLVSGLGVRVKTAR